MGDRLQIKSSAIPLGGRPTNWRIIIQQGFSHSSESSEPTSGSPAQEFCGRKSSEAQFRESHRNRDNKDFTLTGCTQNLTCSRTQGKSSSLIVTQARPTCWSWKIFQRGMEQLWFTAWAQTLVATTLGRSFYYMDTGIGECHCGIYPLAHQHQGLTPSNSRLAA